MSAQCADSLTVSHDSSRDNATRPSQRGGLSESILPGDRCQDVRIPFGAYAAVERQLGRLSV
jgi:hypothetical protein